MEQDLLVLTPEKTIVSFRVAAIGPRVLAQILDLVIVVVALFGFWIALSPFGMIDSGLTQGLAVFASLAIPLSYFILLEGLWNGQTLGKKAAGIRVRMSDGTPVRFGAALGRNLMRPADMLPGFYFLGLIAMFTNPKSQRIGDLIADTVVTEDKLPEAMFAITPHSVGLHPLEGSVGDLKGMTIPEYNALRRFADRFPELSPDVQTKLVDEVWRPIATRRKIPTYQEIHPIYLAEAAVMKYGRMHGLL